MAPRACRRGRIHPGARRLPVPPSLPLLPRRGIGESASVPDFSSRSRRPAPRSFSRHMRKDRSFAGRIFLSDGCRARRKSRRASRRRSRHAAPPSSRFCPRMRVDRTRRRGPGRRGERFVGVGKAKAPARDWRAAGDGLHPLFEGRFASIDASDSKRNGRRDAGDGACRRRASHGGVGARRETGTTGVRASHTPPGLPLRARNSGRTRRRGAESKPPGAA
jgi:hypothetical protein